MIDLKKIVHQNLYDIVNLSVAEDQKRFISSNTDSILQAYPKDSIELPEITRGNYCLWRIMIDQRYQNKGYAKAALEMGLAYIKQLAMGAAQYCWLCYQPETR